ncbi:MAG: thiamine biosynthesis lipoprotein ApbE [Phycisphaerae bacterium]|nr:MAG: thiamine biosynthesis lipoprotein ApbE [Phycisphaerae bacterium]
MIRAWMVMVLGVLAACAPLKRYEFARVCMGVEARVTLYAGSPAAAELAAAEAFGELARLDAMMSDYRPSSQVSAMGREAGGAWAPIAPELESVLRLAGEVSSASGGAFDVTAGPMTHAWRETRRTGRLPTPEELERLRGLVDWRGVEVALGRARLARAGMRVDLGGIAKGYAAQRAVDRLRARGVPRCLVALAGDIVAGGEPPGRPGWHVEVRGRDGPVGVLLLARQAASTSGDTEQFVEIDGVRYAHLVDPRTGLGSSRRVSATVIAPRGELADALATAACLLTPDEAGVMLARFPGTACVLVEGEPGASPAARYLGATKAMRWHTGGPVR